METINLQCISLFQIHTFQCVLQAENSMIGKEYMEEALIQVWLKSIL